MQIRRFQVMKFWFQVIKFWFLMGFSDMARSWFIFLISWWSGTAFWLSLSARFDGIGFLMQSIMNIRRGTGIWSWISLSDDENNLRWEKILKWWELSDEYYSSINNSAEMDVKQVKALIPWQKLRCKWNWREGTKIVNEGCKMNYCIDSLKNEKYCFT